MYFVFYLFLFHLFYLFIYLFIYFIIIFFFDDYTLTLIIFILKFEKKKSVSYSDEVSKKSGKQCRAKQTKDKGVHTIALWL